MLGAAGNLALMPDYRTFVIVSILIYVALFCLIETFVRSTRFRRFIEVVVTAVFIIFSMVWSAYHDPGPLLLDKGSSFRRLSSNIDVQLLDVYSLRGWGEGEAVLKVGHEELLHGDNATNRRLFPPWIFNRIFDRMGLPRQGAEVRAMPQRRWFDFLRGLSDVHRRQIGKIPFANIAVRTRDGQIREYVMFRNDIRIVRDGSGAVVGVLCLDHIFDVADVVSGEREAVVLRQGRSRCE